MTILLVILAVITAIWVAYSLPVFLHKVSPFMEKWYLLLYEKDDYNKYMAVKKYIDDGNKLPAMGFYEYCTITVDESRLKIFNEATPYCFIVDGSTKDICVYHNGDLYLCYYARVINPLFYSQYSDDDIANIDKRDKELVEKAKQDMARLSAEIAELQAQVDELTSKTKKDIV